jgi:hypothetical protein
LFSRILLTGDTEATEKEYMSACLYSGRLTVHQRLETTHSEPRFRALLTEEASEVELALV